MEGIGHAWRLAQPGKAMAAGEDVARSGLGGRWGEKQEWRCQAGLGCQGPRKLPLRYRNGEPSQAFEQRWTSSYPTGGLETQFSEQRNGLKTHAKKHKHKHRNHSWKDRARKRCVNFYSVFFKKKKEYI